ncbi:uncharacterized protein LOC125652040 [Ostrea edulis]|uniref:uncharacterized protein LOC125652040 n=1 Tax=Ostrea edulis TaxID=37623 RepID=UPI00209458EB|nr:uncharacterized protein LOC125652040 [Ostrea edulis]
MSPLRVSLLFLLGLFSGCQAANPSCQTVYQEGMSKCFSDIFQKPSDNVIAVLIEDRQNPEIEDTICSNKAKIVSCVDGMTAEVSKRPACKDPMSKIGIAYFTTGFTNKMATLCGKGTQPKSINH